MPLIILTGFPSCGKTTRGNELKKYFEEEKNKTVHIVSEDIFIENFTPKKVCYLIIL